MNDKLIKPLFLLLTATLLISCSGAITSDAPFTVDGELINVPDSLILVLFEQKRGEKAGHSVASDTLCGGRFHFSAVPVEGSLYNIIAIGEGVPSMGLNLYVEPGSRVKVRGKNCYIMTWDVKSRVKAQRDYQRYISMAKGELDHYARMDNDYTEGKTFKTSYEFLKESSQYYLDNIAPKELSWLKDTEISDAWLRMLEGYTEAALRYNVPEMVDESKALYKTIPDELKNDVFVGKIARYLSEASSIPGEDEKLSVGDIFPSRVIVYDRDGEKHTIKEHDGTVRLLYFSGKGCHPCEMAKPQLADIEADASLGVKVIELSVDDYPVWERNVRESPAPWTQYNDHRHTNGIFRYFDATGIPLFVLLSKDGEILGILYGYLEEGLVKLLELAPTGSK